MSKTPNNTENYQRIWGMSPPLPWKYEKLRKILWNIRAGSVELEVAHLVYTLQNMFSMKYLIKLSNIVFISAS